MGLKEKADQQVNIIRTLLKGKALDTFNTQSTAELDRSSSRPSKPTLTNIQNAIKKLTLEAFDNDQNACRQQVPYMRYNLCFVQNEFEKFNDRLRQINNHLRFFPIPTGKDKVESPPQDQSVEIIDGAKPMPYHSAMLQNNYDPYAQSLEQDVRCIKNLEAAAQIEKAAKSTGINGDNSHNDSNSGKGKDGAREAQITMQKAITEKRKSLNAIIVRN